jgi:hypothetical protein
VAPYTHRSVRLNQPWPMRWSQITLCSAHVLSAFDFG